MGADLFMNPGLAWLDKKPKPNPPIPVKDIAEAARILRSWATDRQKVNNKWTEQEQIGINCATELEKFLRTLG